ncbi:hypothetical protein KBB08_03015 [Candidatus Gracilibacteria bacterium]|nr:hypothetical protein [Candidatus Gracilibacteria bacterium]
MKQLQQQPIQTTSLPTPRTPAHPIANFDEANDMIRSLRLPGAQPGQLLNRLTRVLLESAQREAHMSRNSVRMTLTATEQFGNRCIELGEYRAFANQTGTRFAITQIVKKHS